MATTLTPLLRLILFMALLWFLQLVSIQNLSAQTNTTTPTFNVDLTANPNGVWRSGELTRNGQLCGADNNDNCVQFNITLHPHAGGLQFLILSGPMPSGSMGYQVDCGPKVPVGQPMCVNGPGPHVLTLCMPGNAKGSFEIRSIPAFNPTDDISVTTGCSATLQAPTAFLEQTITWRDISGRGYEKFMSFPNGKANPIVTPDATAPAYVDYEVCGTSQASECATLPYCDVVRVFFYPAPAVTIGPNPAIICPGGSSLMLMGNVTGGDGEFQYIWTDGNGNVVGNELNYTATAVGTYTLEARNKNYPSCQKFSASVNVVTNLKVNAGADQLACASGTVQLAGTVTAATGGIWSGGSGTFSDRNALDAVYTPSSADLSAGSVRLTLTSTGNGSCTAVTDEVLISFYSMNVSLTGPRLSLVCDGNRATITANVTGAQGTVSYLWNTGETTASITNKPAGTYTVAVQDGNGCALEKSITITQATGPTALAASLKPSTCGNSNGEITITGVTGGTASYTYSRNGTTFQSAPTFTGLAAGNYTITVKDANECMFSTSFTLTNSAGPTAVAATSTPASCQNNDGRINIGPVTGGTAPYEYAVGNSGFQTSTAFTGLAAGAYTVTVRDLNGCLKTTPVTILTSVPISFTSTVTAATCGHNDGEVTVTGVTGGFAPYSYSKDGTAFQESATLQNLLPGTHTITVKDDKGCTISRQVQVGNVAGPTDLSASTKAATCGSSNGEITITGVTGGTGSYTYSIDGNSFQASATFTALAAGAHTITVKDDRGCTYSEEVAVNNIIGPAFTATPQSSTCGGSNGSISVSNVAGGIGPYTYSKDGVNYQNSATFNNLKADTYTILVKDAIQCVGAVTVKVEDIAGPSDVTLEVFAATCDNNNGYFRVLGVTGGTAPYKYARNGVPFQDFNTFGNLTPGDYTVSVRDYNNCTFTKSVKILGYPSISGIAGKTKPTTCSGSNGEVAITEVRGGTAPYRYSKDGGTTYQSSSVFTGLAAGTHYITVRDNVGCTIVQGFAVTDIAGPTAVAATSSPASCLDSDGTITAGTVTGGTAPYSYSIGGGSFQPETVFAGVASGVYTLTARDYNGCTTTTQVRVGTNVPTSFTSTTVSATCGSSNGSLTITGVTGGTASYTYSKDGGATFQGSATFTALAAGSHAITVKDNNGCMYTGQVQVNNLSGPSDLEATSTSTTCGGNNGAITVTSVSGGFSSYTYSLDGTNYQEATTFAALTAGEYQVSVKDAKGCVYIEEVVITDIAAPTFTATAQASTCGGTNGSITISGVTGGKAPYSYSKDESNFQDGTTFTALTAGDYTITVKDGNGCLSKQLVTVQNIPGPTDFTVASASSTCGGTNGSITASAVTGGTAPYKYSIDGTNFQDAAVFTSVRAGNYTVTVKDYNGCVISKRVTVSDVAGPTDFTASLTASTCGSSNGELTVTGITGGTASYTYSKDGGNFQASATFTALAAGQHTITVKDANGCTFARSFTITNIAGPTAVTATSTPASCLDNDGSITAGAVTGGTASYTYSINGTNFQSEKAFAGVASGTYTLTAKDANGCTTTTQVTVGTNVPTGFTSTSTASTCGDSNGELTITGVTGGAAPYTYSINGSAYQNNPTFSALAAGVYEVSVKDARGCVYKDNVQLSNVGGPAFTAMAKAATCSNSNGQVTASNVTGGTAPYAYSIDGENFQATATFSNLAAGTYNITTQDINGCSTTQTVEVENITGPSDFEFLVTASTCGNSNGQLNISAVTGGTASYSYSINGTDFQSGTTFTALAAREYTVTVKDANGCTVQKKAVVENFTGPTDFTASTVTSFCGNANGEVTIFDVTGGVAPYTYSKDGSTFQASTTLKGLAAGNHTISVKDVNGCTFSKTYTIANVAGPSALAVTSRPATCAGNDGNITTGGVTGGTAPYAYSLDGVNYQSAATFASLAPREYQVYVKDANNCTTTTTVTVGSESVQNVTLAATPSGCTTSTGTITVTEITGGAEPYAYSINGTSFQEAALFENLAVGSYTITVKDAAGCTITRTQDVVSTGGATSLTATTTNASCGGADGSITISNVNGGRSPYTYSINGSTFQSQAAFANLSAGDYQLSVKDAAGCVYVQAATVGSNGQLANLQVKVTPAGCGQNGGQVIAEGITGGTAPYTYSLDGVNFSSSATFTGVAPGQYELTVKDASNCSITTSVEVQAVSSTLAHVKDESCFAAADGEIAITATGTTDRTEYSINNGISFQKRAVFTNLPKGVYQVITRFSATCSISIGSVEVKGPEEIRATITPLTKTYAQENVGSAAVTKVEGGVKPYAYKVDNDSFSTSTEFTNLSAGVHKLLVKDANGCTIELTFTIEDVSGIEIPNGFTPNGDGLNDRWEIKNLARLYPRCRVSVYNRWGSQVFESIGYNREWDGTYNGKKLPVSTYYCIVELGDGQPPLKKSLTIMR